MKISETLFGAALCLFAFGGVATAASARSHETPVASRLPAADRVERDYAPDSVRQAGACGVMRDVIADFAGSAVFAKRGADAERYQGYLKCNSKYMVPLYGGPEEKLDEANAIIQSEAFEKSVAKRYLTPADYNLWVDHNRYKWRMRASERSSLATGNMLFVVAIVWQYLVLLLIAAFFAWRAMRPWRYDNATGLLRFGGRTFTAYRSSGVVAEASAGRSTTYVPGSQTTHTTAHGWTTTTSTPGHSYTTLHETIHLVNKDGAENVMRLDDWNISARGGHMLGAVYAIRKGKSSGPYLRIWNFSLDEATSNNTALKKMFGMGFLGWAGAAFSTTAALLIAALLLINLNPSGSVHVLDAAAMFLAAIGGIVVATVLHLRIRGARHARFDREVAAPMRATTERDAQAAADRMRSPISRAD